MKQAELNVIFEQSAMLINELPPAFDELSQADIYICGTTAPMSDCDE